MMNVKLRELTGHWVQICERMVPLSCSEMALIILNKLVRKTNPPPHPHTPVLLPNILPSMCLIKGLTPEERAQQTYVSCTDGLAQI